jgi:hypothetical protein
MFRGINEDIINKHINEDLIFGGMFLQNKIEDSKFYNNFKKSFFKLYDTDDQYVCSEMFSLFEADGKQKASKRITHPVKGNAYKIKGVNPKRTFLSEAIIDAYSLRGLVELSGENPDDNNFYSIQGCGHLNNWFQLNIGFGFEINEQQQKEFGRIYGVEKENKTYSIPDKKLEEYKRTFENKKLIFLNYQDEESVQCVEKLELLNDIFNNGENINVIDKGWRGEYINYKDFDQETSFFLDSSSLNKFLEFNSLSIENGELKVNEKSLKKYVLKNEDKIKLRTKFNETFGEEGLVLGFDNDEAGLKYNVLPEMLRNELNVKAIHMIPEVDKKDPDFNDMLLSYISGSDANKEKVLDNFKSQLNNMSKKNKIDALNENKKNKIN